VLHYSNYGHSSFHSGTVKVEKRMSHGFSLASFYTFSKSIDEDSDDSAAGGLTFYNRRLEKARSDFDITHRWRPTGSGNFRSAWKEMDAGCQQHQQCAGQLGAECHPDYGKWDAVRVYLRRLSNVYLPGGTRANMASGATR
jgi:hypothetical protein